MPLSGRIIEWNRDRGFGYVESDQRRLFLHIRDFAERHKVPEIGDLISFEVGADRQGRPCAQQAVHYHDGGRLRAIHGFILVFLFLPGLAVHRLVGRTGLVYVGGWVLGISILTYAIYAWDKRQARLKGQREREAWLHFLELLGGWPGAFVAQRRLRHKSSKGEYQFAFVFIIGLHQFIAIDALRGWPVLHALLKLWHSLK